MVELLQLETSGPQVLGSCLLHLTFRGKMKRVESQLIKETFSQHETSLLWLGSGHGEDGVRLPGSGQRAARRQPGEVGSSEGKVAQRPTAFVRTRPLSKITWQFSQRLALRCLPSLAPVDLRWAHGLCAGSQVAQVPVSAQDPVLRTLSAAWL